MNNAHTLLTRKICPCDKTSDTSRCPVCDWGLSVCANCGAAESELDRRCQKAPNPFVTPAGWFALFQDGTEDGPYPIYAMALNALRIKEARSHTEK